MFKYQLKIINRPSLWLALVIGLGLPFFVPFKYLDAREMIHQSEKYLVFMGMIFLPDLMSPEVHNHLGDMVYQVGQRHSKSLLIRSGLAYLLLGLFTLSIYTYAWAMGSEVNLKIFTASLITTFFIGLLGLTLASLTNLATGYLITFSYYVIDLMTKGKYMGGLTLFAYNQEGFEGKLYLALASLAMLTFLAIYYRIIGSLRATEV